MGTNGGERAERGAAGAGAADSRSAAGAKPRESCAVRRRCERTMEATVKIADATPITTHEMSITERGDG